MMKRLGMLVAVIILLVLATWSNALAAENLSATGTIAVFSIAEEKQLRNIHSCMADMDDLSSGEYYSFCFELVNNGDAPCTISTLYARINGGEALKWGTFELAAHTKTLCHIYYPNMRNIKPGTYKVDLYSNDKCLASQYFTIRKSWSSAMALPSQAESDAFRSADIAPYIVCEPVFPGVKGYTEYAVDFKADYLPRGTYLSVCNWAFDLSGLKKQYKTVDSQWGVSGYCGFQVHADGTKAAILSLWDVYCKDQNGRTTTIRGQRLYPSQGIGGETFGGEGVGVHCLVPYEWEEGHPYRALLQLSESATNGHTVVAFWVCDLLTNQWTLLIEYDTGLTNTHICWSCAFLENYENATAGQIRTMELSNIRVFSTDRRWVNAKSAKFMEEYHHPGSYSYGADDSSFWVVTTGLPNRGKQQSERTYSVSRYETGSPY